ncbi:MAG: hypothetical protein GWP10_07680 [Nitrospiraceae bacterium]|nr:hypothetical protein [Nitrospiraceae bacterium]
MNKIIVELKKIVDESPNSLEMYKKNLLKDYLQVLVLKYIYTQERYQNLIFYGGSALSQCYGLNRLSEDLDFVDIRKKVDIVKLANDLQNFFQKEFSLPIKIKTQKFRIYLKFPILKELKLANNEQSDLLFLKVEIFSDFDFCQKYKIEIKPLFKFNQSVLVKTFNLSTLMATKIRAVLYRRWQKIDKEGKAIIKVKGRDYFDLMWYLSKEVKPNWQCIGIKDNRKFYY